jgi:apolipoprotein N-acyltransferase
MIYPTLERYTSESKRNWNADLILWPETAVTVLLHQAQDYLDNLSYDASINDTTLITGIPYMYPSYHPLAGRFHNSVVSIGTGEGIYHKQQLVPFGEYVPLENMLRGLIQFFNLPMSSFLRGSSDQDLLKAKVSIITEEAPALKKSLDYLIAPFICYEIVYPQLVSEMSRNANILVTVSNDAWFGTSNGPLQHLASARMRALENGRYLLRATNTGVTTLIDPMGNIVSRLPAYQLGTLVDTAQLTKGLTPFGRTGVWPMVVFSFLLLLACGLITRKQTHKNTNK